MFQRRQTIYRSSKLLAPLDPKIVAALQKYREVLKAREGLKLKAKNKNLKEVYNEVLRLSAEENLPVDEVVLQIELYRVYQAFQNALERAYNLKLWDDKEINALYKNMLRRQSSLRTSQQTQVFIDDMDQAVKMIEDINELQEVVASQPTPPIQAPDVKQDEQTQQKLTSVKDNYSSTMKDCGKIAAHLAYAILKDDTVKPGEQRSEMADLSVVTRSACAMVSDTTPANVRQLQQQTPIFKARQGISRWRRPIAAFTFILGVGLMVISGLGLVPTLGGTAGVFGAGFLITQASIQALRTSDAETGANQLSEKLLTLADQASRLLPPPAPPPSPVPFRR